MFSGSSSAASVCLFAGRDGNKVRGKNTWIIYRVVERYNNDEPTVAVADVERGSCTAVSPAAPDRTTDTLLVEGLPVGCKDRLGRVDGAVAGRAGGRPAPLLPQVGHLPKLMKKG